MLCLYFKLCSCSIPGYIPNGIEAIEAMLATASIGAIWSSASPDFGVSVDVIQRLKQIFTNKCLLCWV